jgi:hypothetical protein
VYSPGDGCTFWEQQQKALRFMANMVFAVQQASAPSLGVVLIFGVKQH